MAFGNCWVSIREPRPVTQWQFSGAEPSGILTEVWLDGSLNHSLDRLWLPWSQTTEAGASRTTEAGVGWMAKLSDARRDLQLMNTREQELFLPHEQLEELVIAAGESREGEPGISLDFEIEQPSFQPN
jgi:hypothetical protein